jgi:cysteine desulfurase
MTKISGYFDYAAATPIDPKVLKAMQPYFSDAFYNPSASYQPAREVKEALESARSTVAKTVGAKPVEIIFTAGATEANNLAIHGIMRKYPDANVVISDIEHESVQGPAQHYEHKILPVDKKGVIQLDSLPEIVDDSTVLVSVMLANNEIGTVQPIARLARELEAMRKRRLANKNTLPILLHCDGAQGGNYLDMHVHRMGVDLFSINGGKIYGPKQSGVLYMRSGVVLEPLIDGGGQERGLRSGTESVPSAVGLAAALTYAQAVHGEERARVAKLQKYLLDKINVKLPQAIINGSLKHRLPNNVHLTIPGQDSERLIMLLDDKGFYAASGSACSASSEEPSHVLGAIGLSENDIRASLRLTMGRYTAQADIDQLIECLADILA